jgi:hypothetical protein
MPWPEYHNTWHVHADPHGKGYGEFLGPVYRLLKKIILLLVKRLFLLQ